MCNAERMGLCSFCPQEEKCEHERKITRLALAYWNWMQDPPDEYKEEVLQFIADHPKHFKGYIPM